MSGEIDTHFYRLGDGSNSDKLSFIVELYEHHDLHGPIVVFDREGFKNYRAKRSEEHNGCCHILDTTCHFHCGSDGGDVGNITGRGDAVLSAKSKIEELTGYKLTETDPLNGGRDM